LKRRSADARRGLLLQATTGVRLGEAAAEWLRYVRDDRRRRLSTVNDYRNVAGQLLDAFGAETPLEAIITEQVDRYRAALVADGQLSARTINKRLVALHAIFKRAQRAYGLSTNPVVGVERQPLARSGDFAVLSPPEVEALARACAGEQDGSLLTVAAFTGLRLGELLELRWGDLDFPGRVIHVRRSRTRGQVGPPKSGRVRSVPLIDPAARALDALSQRGRFTEAADLVFVNEVGAGLDDAALRRRFYAALDRAGLERLRLHDLRHSFGTLAVQAFPLSDVQAYMGHADIQTTMRYIHHVPRVDAAERLSQVVAAQLSLSPTLSPTPQISEELREPQAA